MNWAKQTFNSTNLDEEVVIQQKHMSHIKQISACHYSTKLASLSELPDVQGLEPLHLLET